MEQFLIELDYIQSHFPQFITSLIPKVLVGIMILQVILGLIKFSFRNAETGRAERIKSGIITVSLILWVIMAVLFGTDLYYYFTYMR